jgi:hypothetical protein
LTDFRLTKLDRNQPLGQYFSINPDYKSVSIGLYPAEEPQVEPQNGNWRHVIAPPMNSNFLPLTTILRSTGLQKNKAGTECRPSSAVKICQLT